MEKQVKIKLPRDILFLLGATASIQLLSIGGITVHNILLIVNVAAAFIWGGKYTNDKWQFFMLLVSIVTLIYSQTFAGLDSDFKRSALVSGVSFLIILLIYSQINSNPKLVYRYIEGFDFTCKLAIVWCYLQVLLYTFFTIDLNMLFFKQVLGVEENVSDYVNGSVIPTGFYGHRGYMIPILLYSYFRTRKIRKKLLIVVIAFLTRSAAVSIGIIACVCCEVFYKVYRAARGKIKLKAMLAGAVAIVAVFVLTIVFSKQMGDLFSNLMYRITSAKMNIADNSSTTHFYYYKNFGNIVKNLNVVEFLLGTGFGTSGLQYTLLYGQYANIGSWVVESDLINIFIGQGIIGFALWLFALMRIIMLCVRKHKYYEHVVFIIIILGVGIMYNIQFNWFILLELCIYSMLKKGVAVFSWDSNSLIKSGKGVCGHAI